MARRFYDFSEFSTGAVSSVGGSEISVLATAGGTWTHTINTDGGATGGQTLVMTRTTTGSGANIVSFDQYATTGDVEIVVRVKTAAVLNSPNAVPVILASTATAGAGYSMRAVTESAPDCSYDVTRVAANGGVGASGAPDISITQPAGNEYFWARVQRRGSAIKGRVWNDGEEEGSTWSVIASDTTYSELKPGFYTYNYVDYPYTCDVAGIATGTDITDVGAGAPTAEIGGSIVPLLNHYRMMKGRSCI